MVGTSSASGYGVSLGTMEKAGHNLLFMDTAPPGKSTSREIVERIGEAALGSVPLVGAALAVSFVTALGWRLEQRREKWFTQLAEGLEELRQRVEDLDLETLADNDLFVDAVVTATRTVEHTHQEDKISALRNAVLNSVAPDAPDADTQAIFLNLIDRFTPRWPGAERRPLKPGCQRCGGGRISTCSSPVNLARQGCSRPACRGWSRAQP
jgi:hypothetical protein